MKTNSRAADLGNASTLVSTPAPDAILTQIYAFDSKAVHHPDSISFPEEYMA